MWFLISLDIKNHVFFFKNLEPKATSNRRQATGRWGGGPTGSKQVIHRLSTVRVIHRLSTEKIFRCLLMGFSMKRWDHEQSKNYCSCEPTHDQVQPETRRGVSGSNGEAQRQDLLRSRSALLRLFKNPVSTTQTSELWGCVLGGDRGERDSLRLDRGSPGEASLHQVKASDGSPAWVQILDQLCSCHHSLQPRNLRKNYRSINSKQALPGLAFLQKKSYKLQAASIKRQATSFPAFGYRRVGGPISDKLFNRGPWIKFYGSWSEGLD